MNRINHKAITIVISIWLTVLSSHLLALADDKDQPINVAANTAHKNDKKGLTVYRGDVIITQGSIRITGDEITIYDTAGNVEKIIATGTPAKFKQKPSPTSDDMIAHGFTIEYDVVKESLLLRENALLKQEGRTTNSNRITYDMKTTIVKAGNDTGRVNMVLQPSSK